MPYILSRGCNICFFLGGGHLSGRRVTLPDDKTSGSCLCYFCEKGNRIRVKKLSELESKSCAFDHKAGPDAESYDRFGRALTAPLGFGIEV